MFESKKKSINFNAHTSNEEWEEIFHLGKKIHFSENELIDVQKGTRSFFFIVSGLIKLSYIEASGLERLVRYAYPGTLLNVVNVLLQKTNNTMFTCLEETEVIAFEGKILQDPEFIKSYPNIIGDLLKYLAHQSELHFQQLGNASVAKTKIYLCRLFLEMSQNSKNPTKLVPHITQAELAMFLGVNLSTLTRIIVQLKQDNIIEKFTKKELLISDLEGLTALADND